MMEGWKKVLLGDLIDINSESIGRNYPYTEINYYDISSVKSGYVENIGTISLLSAPSRAKRIVKDCDTILSTVRPRNRSFFYFRRAKENDIVSTGFAVLRPKTNKIDDRYLYYLITDYNFTAFLASNVKGAAYPAVTADVIERAKISLPPLPTQRKIAKILSAYDDLIENNLKRIKLLEEMAQITYEEWFVRMKFPGHETAVFDKETGLPEGWEKVKLGEEIEILSSKRIFLSEYVSNGIPFYRGKEISLKSNNNALSDILYISKKRYNEIKMKYGAPKSGDILITAVGTIGSSYLVTESDGDFYFKDGNLIWLKGNNNFSSKYLISFFKNKYFKTLLNNIAIGSSQKAITIKSLKTIAILKPSKLILEHFDKLINSILLEVENLHNQNQRLKEARDILLPRLMTEMIDVDKIKTEL